MRIAVASILVALLWPLVANAGRITAQDGQEITIPVGVNGITIQLPDFVKIVTPSQSFQIRPVMPQTPPGQGGVMTDVQAFTVRAINLGLSERITFIMTNSKTVTVLFVPGQGMDNFFDIRWPKKRSRLNDNQFLASERALMLTMLHDFSEMDRKAMSKKVELKQYPELAVNLVRTYQSDGLSGYVFTFVNRSSKTLTVNPTVLAIGTPNRAILTQMDHNVLKSCKEDNSLNPRGTGCMSAVRIVARGEGTPSIATNARIKMPFIVSEKEKK